MRSAPTEQGTVLLMILLSLFAVGLMSMVVAQVATTEVAISANITAGERAFLPADGASQILLRDLIEMSRTLGRFPTDTELATITAPSFSYATLTQFTAASNGPMVPTTIASGMFVGLSAEVQPFHIIATTETPGPIDSEATVEIHGEFAEIPIFQFGILYEGDLDIHNGPVMYVSGRVHGNSDIWIDPNTEVSFNSTITAAGNIYNTHEAGYTDGGDVRIQDSDGAYQNMDGLDSNSTDWSSDAIARWHGRVRSGDLGADRVDLVIEDPTNPHLIVEAGRTADTAADNAAKVWYQAGLRVVNGRGYDPAGNLVSLTDPVTGTSSVEKVVIWDAREQKHMLTFEIDIDKLSRTPGYPNNGVVYVGAFEPDADMPLWPGGAAGVGPVEWEDYDPPWTTTATEFAVKASNGALLNGPLTLVTENPLYLEGAFNTVNKKPAAILADAVTILSNNWGDVDNDGDSDGDGEAGDPDGDLAYSEQDLSLRNAASTTVNAAILTGNVEMGATYNGGVENLPRLLENWAGVQLTILGSLSALWESQVAVGLFGTSGVYAAPDRNWAFDTDFLDLANLPPETPRMYTITVTGWKHR